LLELERSELVLSAPWVLFPCDGVQVQLLLHPIALLIERKLVHLLLRLAQHLCAERCGQIGAHGVPLPQMVELPLHMREFVSAREMLQLCALGEFADVLLLGHVHPLWAEWVGRRPVGGRSQQQSAQQQTCNNGPEQLHRRTSLSL
jgi:hypothetical protein